MQTQLKQQPIPDMRIIFILILLMPSLCFSQIIPVNTGATNNDGTGDTLRAAFGKINTNFYYATNIVGIASNSLAASIVTTSNSVSSGPSLIATNWISGQLYTNLSGRFQFVQVTAVTTYSTVAGAAIQRLLTGPQGAALTNVAGYGAQTIIGSIGTTNLGIVCGPVLNGWVFSFSNSVAGAGDAAANIPGTGFQITY